MTHYSDDPTRVRVDFWKPSSKWYTTESVKWTGDYKNCLIHQSFRKSLQDHFGNEPRLVGMTATCLEPYHEHSHPISLVLDQSCYKVKLVGDDEDG